MPTNSAWSDSQAGDKHAVSPTPQATHLNSATLLAEQTSQPHLTSAQQSPETDVLHGLFQAPMNNQLVLTDGMKTLEPDASHFFQGYPNGPMGDGGVHQKPANGYNPHEGVAPIGTTGFQPSVSADAPTSPSQPPAGRQWVLTFNDNFHSAHDITGDSVAHHSNWTDHSWWHSGHTNYSIKNGVLDIPGSGQSDGSIMTINSQGKGFTQRYGFFEASIWQPNDTNHWTGFWMMSDAHAQSTSNSALGNAASSEIDIMEQMPGQAHDQYYATTHEDSFGPRNDDYQNQNNAVPVPNINLAAGWHTYGVDWEPSGLTYYLDGKPVMKVPASQFPSLNSSPMFLVLGNGNGGGDMKVAWVRAYQNKQLYNSHNDGSRA